MTRNRPAGGVVTAVESDAAEAGAEILRAGGNAADAAVAAAFAEGVVNPVRCGIGGGMMGQFHDAATGTVRTLWSMGRAPRKAHDRMFTPTGHWGTLFKVEGSRNQLGYEASVVPGFVRGAHEALRRYGSGRISWKEILAPAIRLALDGFDVYPHAYMMWSPAHSGHDFLGVGPRTITFTDAARQVFTKADGGFYEIGERMVQRDYGATLERIAEHGPEEFYRGETGERIAADFAANGGYLSLDDLLEFQAEEYTPLTLGYRGYSLVTEDA
ncbi:gamma-glutamyltransferase, partial [Streptomyces anulatus]|uniref:gamma-glutamyltransferase n=1 Tax=Streptomyces anulatus TaxID=1892 RepID=UPI00343C47D5